MAQVGYLVEAEYHLKRWVWFDEDENHCEDAAIDWVFGNEKKDMIEDLFRKAEVTKVMVDDENLT